MPSTSFTPYWRQLGPPENPYSFVFFVVAHIAGHHRPIAVVSSRASADRYVSMSMQGHPLIAACHRITTIFSDTTNHPAIKAELGLAEGYYMRNGGREEYRADPVELPENLYHYRQPILELAAWDQASVREFPFITACLLQGVAWNTQGWSCYEASPEPLGTVYRDTNVEWGMVVVDITKLHEVRYGIVGFAAAPMKWASSEAEIYRQQGPQGASFATEPLGKFRVVDEVRPRVVLSAAEYLAKMPAENDYEYVGDRDMAALLAPIPLVNTNALELIWPSDSDSDVLLPMIGLSVETEDLLHEQAIRVLLSTIDVDSFDTAIFEKFREVPNFQEILRHNLLQNPVRLGTTLSAGQLLRLAFADGEHLGLEQLSTIPVRAILAALNVHEMGKITSLSLCIDSFHTPSIELIEGLSRSESLRRIYFMQSPFQESDMLSRQLFEALSSRPQFLSKVEVMFAGSYSAALSKNFWLSTVPKKTHQSASSAVQVAPLSIFPMQQILVRRRRNIIKPGNVEFQTSSVYLGDSLLSPERFATGFLAYLRTFLLCPEDRMNPAAQIFSFSSAPTSLNLSPLTSAKISPILAENFALENDSLPRGLTPQIRDLVPEGWTVLVSFEDRRYVEAAGSQDIHERAALRDRNVHLECIRYALVRTRRAIEVDNPPLESPGLDELEVVGLKDFLTITAPEVDSSLVNQCLADVAEHRNRLLHEVTLPRGVETISVLGHGEAGDMLLECLKDARESNKNLDKIIQDKSEVYKLYGEQARIHLD